MRINTPQYENFRRSLRPTPAAPLYTPEQRIRRDNTRWTLVQGVLAPVQFLIFLVSLILVLRYLQSGEGAFAATVSIVVKTMALYTIMVTGAIWEKVVFDKYLFANAFFWEDVFSFLVIGLHTAYLVMLIGDYGTERGRMLVALAAYATYVVNAVQFILKLRAARLQSARDDSPNEAVANYLPSTESFAAPPPRALAA